jgi:ubiquinone/menaquinone biosynthesis C-methylase UbiE
MGSPVSSTAGLHSRAARPSTAAIMLMKIKHAYSRRARQRRSLTFLRLFPNATNQSILDLGGGDGSHIAMVLPCHKDVTIADIDRSKLALAESRYGYKSRVLEEAENLPFDNGEFDIVFCSSVIEHITGSKDTVGNIKSTRVFEEKAALHQQKFAEEVRRIGKAYFVQTPYKYFLIESHTIAPGFVVLLPRSVQLEIWKRWPFYNHVPDFNLLTVHDMKRCFPDAEIHLESVCGLTKSIMAVRRI